ncbi:hypothetical protein WJX73_003091 [Symbiochloris irregularis]|uniref:Nicotinamide phosphoribosyltransferase n=1 Tax=Symbiochloris irregularis TaxID=706552 RepID=A0AAW1NQU0_9CHLO
MTAYGEFRSQYQGALEDSRLIFYGIRYILENYLHRRWTEDDVEKADMFFSTHLAPAAGTYRYPKDLFLKFIRENDGYFPVKLEALPEGSCIHAHVPVFQLTTQGDFAPLCTFMEVLLTMVWYPSAVATLSRRCRDRIEEAFDKSVETGRDSPLLGSRLHDFGFRGCTGVEQSVLGGVAHLINFDGSDTLSAAYYAQFVLNGGEPVASSIPATEHSVMTAWPSERAAIDNMIDQYGDGLFACVMDSFDYAKALGKVLPAVAQHKLDRGGYMILRPDSGDPTEAVLMALQAAEKVFGVDVNAKGYKVPRGCGVIQGDGIKYERLASMLEAVLEAGYSAEAVAFGMGGGLLQKVNRDTMSFATKLSHVVYEDGTPADIMKAPLNAISKSSLPGVLAVKRVDGVPTAFPADSGEVAPEENLLRTVYDCRPVQVNWDKFTQLRRRVNDEWHALPTQADVASASLKAKVKDCLAKLRKRQTD